MSLIDGFHESMVTSENRKDAYLFGEEMYVAGINYVVREMALSQFQTGRIKDTMEAREEFKKARKLYDVLNDSLNTEQQKILSQMFDCMETYAASAEENGFVEGYVTGYKFVKELG